MKTALNLLLRAGFGGFVILCLGWLGGCASGPPLLNQLESEKVNRINVVVEQGAFVYTVPTFPDNPFVARDVTTALLGPLSVVYRLKEAHEKLNAEARGRGVVKNHRQVFVDALVQKFQEAGVTVTVVSAAYQSGFPSADRGFFHPTREDVAKLPGDVPSFYLNLDMGTCTVGVITPCVRYMLNSTGVVSSPGPNQKYRGIALLEPNLYLNPPASSLLRFKSIEDATSKIVDFDAEIERLVPLAVTRMVAGLRQLPAK